MIKLRSSATGLAFLVALVTLATQILVHRIVSAKLLNNYAFLVISLTMLGFACSGILLSKTLQRFLNSFNESVLVCVICFVWSLLGITILFYHMAIGSQSPASRGEFIKTFLFNIPLALLYSIPFMFCGLILGVLLSAKSFPTERIYFFDLCGSALGAFLVLPAIQWVGVEVSLLICCFLLLLGSWILFPPAKKTIQVLSLLTLGLLGSAFQFRETAFSMTYPKDSLLTYPQVKLEHIVWDPVARIELSRYDERTISPETFFFHCLIGENQAFWQRFKRILTQNNYAFTFAVEYDGKKESLEGIEETIYAAAYQTRSVPHPKVLVIGVGGGFDLLTALYFEASEVIGVEINSATLTILQKTYRDYFRALVENPKIQLFHSEGRHFLSTHSEKFDIIQLSGVDTYSGTSACANIFSENYLYTKEAIQLYFSKLTENGILNLMRLEFTPHPREMLRALTTTLTALRELGISEPESHITMLTAPTGNFTALLLKKTPFTAEEVKHLGKWTLKNPYIKISAIPIEGARLQSTYQRFLNLQTPVDEAQFIASYPFNIFPVLDDKPFFFKYSYWWHLWSQESFIQDSIPVMEYSLILLFILISFFVLICVYWPLRSLSKKEKRPAKLWKYGLVLACMGVGYLAIEIALLQKFGLFLGHPNYALSVGLASILLTTGLGSLFSKQALAVLKQPRFVSYLLAVCIFIEYFFVFPSLLSLITLSFEIKIGIVFLLIFPIGFLLGIFMPTVIERLKEVSESYVPWAWGMNGIFSVLAPILCIGISISWGIGALFISAIPLYLLAGFCFPESSPSTRAPRSS